MPSISSKRIKVKGRTPEQEAQSEKSAKEFVKQREELAGQTGLSESAPKTAREIASASIRQNDPIEQALVAQEIKSEIARINAQQRTNQFGGALIDEADNNRIQLTANPQSPYFFNQQPTNQVVPSGIPTGTVTSTNELAANFESQRVAQPLDLAVRGAALGLTAGVVGSVIEASLFGSASVPTTTTLTNTASSTTAKSFGLLKTISAVTGVGSAITGVVSNERQKVKISAQIAADSRKGAVQATNYVNAGGDPFAARKAYDEYWKNILIQREALKRLTRTPIVGDQLANAQDELNTIELLISQKDFYDLKFNNAVINPRIEAIENLEYPTE